jgi:hypothetical protein
MFFLPPDPAADPRFQKAKQWYDAFNPQATGQGELLLDQARRKYDEQRLAYDRLDDKAEALLRFSATIAALIVTALAAWKLQPIILAVPSLICFMASMLFAVLARNPFVRPGMPAANEIIDGIPKTNAPREWMAAGLFVVTEELRVLTDWKGRTVQRSTISLCMAIILSAGLVFMRPV